VQVHVEHLLERRRTVGEEQVDALATQVGPAKCRGEPLGDGEHLTAIRGVQIVEPYRVGFREDEQVTGVHGVEIADRDDPLVFVDDAGFLGARDDAAQQAIHRRSVAYLAGPVIEPTSTG
jgi:hypothetical protein